MAEVPRDAFEPPRCDECDRNTTVMRMRWVCTDCDSEPSRRLENARGRLSIDELAGYVKGQPCVCAYVEPPCLPCRSREYIAAFADVLAEAVGQNKVA